MLQRSAKTRHSTSQLIWVIWLAVALFFFYVSTATLNSYQDTLSRGRTDALAQARLVAEHASNTIDFADLLLQHARDNLRDEDLQSNAHLSTQRRERLETTLKNLQGRVPGVVSMSVTDAQGVVFANSLGIPPGVSLASRNYFKTLKAQDNDAPVVSEAVLGRVSNRWGIQVARRLTFNDGRFAGMLVANVGLSESFDSFYESLTKGKRDAIALYDVESRLISRFPRADHLLGKQLPRNGVSDAFRNLVPEGIIEQASVVDGEVRLFAFRHVPRYPMYALVAPVKSDVLAAWTRERNLNAIYAVMALIAGLYLTRLIRSSERSVNELERFRNHLDAIANGGTALIWTSDGSMLCDYFNEPWLRFTGRTLAQELGNGWTEGIHPDDLDRCLAIYQTHFTQRTAFSMEYRLRHVSGEYRWILDQGNARFSVTGEFLGYLGFCYDITERIKADEQIRQAARVFSHTREGIVFCGRDRLVFNVNQAFTQITGFEPQEVLGRQPSLLQSDQQGPAFYETMWAELEANGQWHGEVWDRRKNGELFAATLTVSVVRDDHGQTEQLVLLFADVTENRLHQKQLEQLANFDTLTKLPNRLLLADRLRQAIVHAERREHKVAVAYLDLDGFKVVNDAHGHAVGDLLLIQIAQHLSACLREGDTLARLGGDEFVAVLTDLESTQAAGPVLDRLLNAANQPIQVDALQLNVSASIGVTYYPQALPTDAEQLLRQADQAMYGAKLAGKNRHAVFDAESDLSMRGHIASLERIHKALENREFVLHYQPKVHMQSGKLVGAEALIRWQHPERGLLGPGEFLPIFENHPLAVDIGEWVIDTALGQISRWRDSGLDLPVSVNIGARQLQQGGFYEKLTSILARHPHVHPSRLELEVLETSALADIAQVSKLIEDCAGIGVRFALDDFGTGYSSLTYLKRLHVALLKIDQSFVRDMLDDPDDLAILEGVIGLASAFGREVIAEGVETVAHGTRLLQMGCELAQGYGIARPMPPDQLLAWAASWQPDAAWTGEGIAPGGSRP